MMFRIGLKQRKSSYSSLLGSSIFYFIVYAAFANTLPESDAEEPQTQKNLPAKILVVINGESNSGGYALNSEAKPEELKVRDSVKILNNDLLNGFESLEIGKNNLLGHYRLDPTQTHGFELAIANLADKFPAERLPVYLVKTGQGGSRISEWEPDGAYFQTMQARIKAAKRELGKESYRSVVLFSLGINDAIAGTNLDVWKPAVKVHLENLRKELGPETPIVMTQFMDPYDHYNRAIVSICEEMTGVFSVATKDASLRDPNHWDYRGMKTVADRMLDAIEFRKP